MSSAVRVHVVFDNSYSMLGNPLIYKALQEGVVEMAAQLEGAHSLFHVFSDYCKRGKVFDELLLSSEFGIRLLSSHADASSGPGTPKGTDIASGFESVVGAERLEKEAAHVVIVFISDGEDTTNRSRLKQLQGLGAEQCTLITVAVGAKFPTSLVLDCLRPLYHTSGLAVPLVVAVEVEGDDPQEPQLALKEVQSLIRTHVLLQEGRRRELWECLGCQDKLLAYARQQYNPCVMLCLVDRRTPEKCLPLLETTRAQLNAVEEELGRMLLTGQARLPGSLLKRRAAHAVGEMLAQLRRLMEKVKWGMDCLTDKDMQEVLVGFKPHHGKFFGKALRCEPHHRALWPR